MIRRSASTCASACVVEPGADKGVVQACRERLAVGAVQRREARSAPSGSSRRSRASASSRTACRSSAVAGTGRLVPSSEVAMTFRGPGPPRRRSVADQGGVAQQLVDLAGAVCRHRRADVGGGRRRDRRRAGRIGPGRALISPSSRRCPSRRAASKGLLQRRFARPVDQAGLEKHLRTVETCAVPADVGIHAVGRAHEDECPGQVAVDEGEAGEVVSGLELLVDEAGAAAIVAAREGRPRLRRCGRGSGAPSPVDEQSAQLARGRARPRCRPPPPRRRGLPPVAAADVDDPLLDVAQGHERRSSSSRPDASRREASAGPARGR